MMINNNDRRDCDIEFGEDHDHDDLECAQALQIMREGYGDDPVMEMLSREATEAALGRPLLPNEY